MKTRRMFKVALVILVFCIMLFTAYTAEATTPYDHGVSNNQKYENYDAWEKENEIRLLMNIFIEEPEEYEEVGINTEKNYKIPSKYSKKIENLREGIISFFKERYQIDVSDKIARQKVSVFDSYGMYTEIYGYVDVEDKDVLNLNKKLFKEDSDKFETTYIHETVHQLGFVSKPFAFIDEGFTDAMADLICSYIGIKPVLTEYYSEGRSFAYQMLKADPEIVKCYLDDEDFSIEERICDKLSNVSYPLEKTENVGMLLSYMMKALFDLNTGTVLDYGVDPYIFAFHGQEIVKAYCQECKPDAETIDYIRAHYLTIDCETVIVKQDEFGYYFE